MLIVLWGTLESNIDDNQDENEERVREICNSCRVGYHSRTEDLHGTGIPNPNPLTPSPDSNCGSDHLRERCGFRLRPSLQHEALVAHEESHMACMQHPSNGLSQGIRRVDDAWDVLEDNLAESTPLLESKVTDHNVAGLLCRAIVAHNLNRRIVVFPNSCRLLLIIFEISENVPEELGDFGTGIGSNEF